MNFDRMNSSEFDLWSQDTCERFAKEIAAQQELEAEQAMHIARKTFYHLLPEGQNSAGHNFYSLSLSSAKNIGFLWIYFNRELSSQLLLYDIVLQPAWVGKGYGKLAMQSLERIAYEQGATSISLNVFASNQEAYRLYHQTGFQPSRINMVKQLQVG